MSVGQEREGKHPFGLDPRVLRTGIEELLPFWSITRDVDIEQDLPEFSGGIATEVDRHGLPVHRDREMLPGNVRGAHLRSPADMAKTGGFGGGAEVENATVEDPVHRTDDRPTVCCDRRQRQQADAAKSLSNVASIEPTFRGVNAPQVVSGGGITPVE